MHIRKILLLSVTMFVLWLLLSGMFDHGLLLVLGVLSSVFVAYLAVRMARVAGWQDGPRLSVTECVRYIGWLGREIVVANWQVARIIASKDMPISPTLVTVKTQQSSELTQVIYANSITLTPGTVSVDVGADEITVHCLTRAGANDIEKGDMDRRVARLVRKH